MRFYNPVEKRGRGSRFVHAAGPTTGVWLRIPRGVGAVFSSGRVEIETCNEWDTQYNIFTICKETSRKILLHLHARNEECLTECHQTPLSKEAHLYFRSRPFFPVINELFLRPKLGFFSPQPPCHAPSSRTGATSFACYPPPPSWADNLESASLVGSWARRWVARRPDTPQEGGGSWALRL